MISLSYTKIINPEKTNKNLYAKLLYTPNDTIKVFLSPKLIF